MEKAKRQSRSRNSHEYPEISAEDWEDQEDLLNARALVSEGKGSRSVSWAIFGYDNLSCGCYRGRKKAGEKLPVICEHPLQMPQLLATGTGGMKAFIEINGENKLTKEMKSLGHLYWIYARINLKDRANAAANDKSKNRLSMNTKKAAKEGVLGSKKLLLMSYRADPSTEQKADFSEEDNVRLLDIKYAMATKVYSHGRMMRKLFHHHLFVESLAKSKLFHRNLYQRVMNVVTVEGNMMVLVMKVKQDMNTLAKPSGGRKHSKAAPVRDEKFKSFVRDREDTNLMYLPLVKYFPTTATILDLKKDVVQSMHRRGFSWQVENIRISVMRNKTNEQVLKSLEVEDEELGDDEEDTVGNPADALKQKEKRGSLISRKSSLPLMQNLVSITNLDDDDLALSLTGLQSGDEVLVEMAVPERKARESFQGRALSFFSFSSGRNSKERFKSQTDDIFESSTPAFPTATPRRPPMINRQALLRRKKDLDFISRARTLEHKDLVKLTSSRKRKNGKKSDDSKRRQSVQRKQQLKDVATGLGANFIQTSDILITKQKPLGVGRTAKVFEGLLRCHVAQGNIQQSMLKGVGHAFEAAKSQRVTIVGSKNGQLKSVLHHKKLNGVRRTKNKKKASKNEGKNLPSVYSEDTMTLEPLEIAVKVAIKRFTARLVTPAVALTFQQEIQALCQIDHEGVVRCLGVYIDTDDSSSDVSIPLGETNLQLLIVYELCTRGDLRVLRSQPSWPSVPFRTRFSMVYPAACALAEIHNRNIVHRDLKSDNILVSEEFTLKLGDFGVAKVLNNADAVEVEAKGTLGYTSPEAFSGTRAGTKESDVFSFGVILYELVCDYGKQLADGKEYVPKTTPFLTKLDDYLDQFEGDKHLATLDFHPKIPKKYVSLVKDCLRENPDNRCTAEDIVNVLSVYVPKKR